MSEYQYFEFRAIDRPLTAEETTAQQALAEFLEVDPDLLAGAGIGSPALQDEEISQKGYSKKFNVAKRARRI
ncbi:MAG: hypothetical protein L3J69_04545 [Desulfobacula sp.]|nr:hypothetical protein [Desulfobacula sp.]